MSGCAASAAAPGAREGKWPLPPQQPLPAPPSHSFAEVAKPFPHAEQRGEACTSNSPVSTSGSSEPRVEKRPESGDAAVKSSGNAREASRAEAAGKTADDQRGSSEGRTANGGSCPFGYDSASFKISPFSCVVCKALLFDSCRCLPCRHIFCRGCIEKFRDCPLCGADIESLEPDSELQSKVDRFIQGHGRIYRSAKPLSDNGTNSEAAKGQNFSSEIEDVSLDRGSFLLQQAVRAFQAGNLVSAKSRLQTCLNDARAELTRIGSNSQELVCQLGAILGLLGDCCRAMGDNDEAASQYSESAELLEGVEQKDLEIVHALSVSLNKQGDLRYYAGDVTAARTFYMKALEIRQVALGSRKPEFSPSLVLDVAVALAKVADVERSLGNEGKAIDGFNQAAEMAKSAVASDPVLERRKQTTIEFICEQTQVV